MNDILTRTILTVALALAAGVSQAQKPETGAGMQDTTDDFPLTMTAGEDSVRELYMSATYLSVSPDCQMTDSTPTFGDDVYIGRLSRLPTEIEMPYNDVVRRFIDRYAGKLRYSVSYMLGAANFYVPFFEEALEAYGLPLELKYLPVIESALNPAAASSTGAAGLWMLSLAAAKDYGLTVNSLLDERRDPLKASYAAAARLNDLYKTLGDWNLVIAAFNSDPAQVEKAIHRAGGERDYWTIYPYMPKELRGYVPAFIAVNYLMSYYCEHGICPMTATLPSKTDTIMTDRNVHLVQVADVLGIDIGLLRALNPACRKDIVPGASGLTALRLPEDKVAAYIDREGEITAYKADELLSRRAVAEVKPDMPEPEKKAVAKKKKNSTKAKYVTIKKGQTLSEIARANGTTVSKLQKLNGLKGTTIRAGKKLRVR